MKGLIHTYAYSLMPSGRNCNVNSNEIDRKTLNSYGVSKRLKGSVTFLGFFVSFIIYLFV